MNDTSTYTYKSELYQKILEYFFHKFKRADRFSYSAEILQSGGKEGNFRKIPHY